MGHFIQRGRDESAQADDIHILFAGGLQDFFTRNHDPEVNHLVVVAGEHDADNVFADVMDVALDGGHEDFAGVFGGVAAGLFLRLHEGHEIGHGLFHHARGFDDLRQKHFARAEQIPDHVHAGHERAFDHLERLGEFLPRLLDVRVNKIHDALHQGVGQALLDRGRAPGVLDDLGLALLLHGFGELDQPFRGVGAAVEQHILDQGEQFLGHLFIDGEHPGVDNAHVHPGADGMV